MAFPSQTRYFSAFPGLRRNAQSGWSKMSSLIAQKWAIIESHYHRRKPLIVTTNLTLTELKNPQDTAHARIYDRLLELCTPTACTGPSMRTRAGQEKLQLLKTMQV
jgi:hypothetical protein